MPRKYERLVRKLKHRKGINPYAVAHAALKRKGKKRISFKAKGKTVTFWGRR